MLKWSEGGEKSTRYFLNLERRNKACKSINKLVNDGGTALTNNNSILEEIENFYRTLYSRRVTRDPLYFFIL